MPSGDPESFSKPNGSFERTAAEAQFSVIGDELRKLGEALEPLIKACKTSVTGEEARAIIKARDEQLTRIEANQRVILQKLEQILGVTNEKLRALEQRLFVVGEFYRRMDKRLGLIVGIIGERDKPSAARRRRKSKHKGK